MSLWGRKCGGICDLVGEKTIMAGIRRGKMSDWRRIWIFDGGKSLLACLGMVDWILLGFICAHVLLRLFG